MKPTGRGADTTPVVGFGPVDRKRLDLNDVSPLAIVPLLVRPASRHRPEQPGTNDLAIDHDAIMTDHPAWDEQGKSEALPPRRPGCAHCRFYGPLTASHRTPEIMGFMHLHQVWPAASRPGHQRSNRPQTEQSPNRHEKTSSNHPSYYIARPSLPILVTRSLVPARDPGGRDES